MSHDPCVCSESTACLLPSINSYAIRRVSSAVNGAAPEILTGTSLPESSTSGWLPGDMIRSLTLPGTRSIANSRAEAGRVLGSETAGFKAGLAAVSIPRSLRAVLEAFYPKQTQGQSQNVQEIDEECKVVEFKRRIPQMQPPSTNVLKHF